MIMHINNSFYILIEGITWSDEWRTALLVMRWWMINPLPYKLLAETFLGFGHPCSTILSASSS